MLCKPVASDNDRVRLSLVLEESPVLSVAFDFFQEGAKACLAILETELDLETRRELARNLDSYVFHCFGMYSMRRAEAKARALREGVELEERDATAPRLAPDLTPVTTAPPPSAG